MTSISRLRIYPIKSLRGTDLAESLVEARGLQHDRRWMLVDAEGEFLTARKDRRMLLFSTAIDEASLRVTAPDGSVLEVGIQESGQPTRAKVWSFECEATTVSPRADAWFAAQLGMECRLVRATPEMHRPIGIGKGEVAFADAMPILVAGESSLAELNRRVGRELEIERFRPNVVLRGSQPFEEDEWHRISLGEVRLRATKRCGRCTVTTLDPRTAEGGTEPLDTLATFRKFERNVCFGMYYAPEFLGRLQLGQVVQPT